MDESATFPPSPPPAPFSRPRTPRKLKRKSDPFLELPDFTIGDGSNDQDGSLKNRGHAQEQSESTLNKVDTNGALLHISPVANPRHRSS